MTATAIATTTITAAEIKNQAMALAFRRISAGPYFGKKIASA
jgi:hypothetical protein